MNLKKNGFIYFTAAVISVVLLAGSFCYVHDFRHGLVFAAAICVLALFPFDRINVKENWLFLYCTVIFLVSGFIAAFLSQLLLNESLLLLGWRRAGSAIIICLFLFLAVFILCISYKISISIVTVLVILLSAVNYYVYEFKGNEFQPADIFAAHTAGNVLGQYKLVVPPTLFYAAAAGIVFLFGLFLLPKIEIKKKRAARAVSAAACLMLGLAFTSLTSHIHAQYFLRTGSSQNGYLLNFVLQMQSNKVKAPESYSPQTVEKLLENYSDGNGISENDSYPDIIVIMDESFADLSCLGKGLQTNMEITPFISSLSKNTVHGNALSSVFGGGTPNSEYEFLTGNSLLFLPEGTYVYSQYLKRPVYSMVSELNSLGYRTVGVHPYYSTGWNRDIIYPLLGFEEIHFKESFEGYNTIRDYISDRGMFDWVIDLYEDNSLHGGQPLFLFGVTMQNHGGYEYTGDNFTPSIKLEGYSNEYSKVEQYLSLIHETDDAVRYLIEYFSKVDRDVVVVFFGDHLPRLDEVFYEEIHGGKFTELEEKELRYEVPFFIWTRYPMEEREISLTSINFLSSYVYEAAGIPLPAYNRFLQEVEKSIPAINSQGYYSLSEQRFKKFDEADGQEYELLNQYNILEYNSLFDSQNTGRFFVK